MNFTPKSDEQIEQEQTFGDPFPRGEYDVMVKEAKDDISKSTSKEQIKLMLVITNEDGHRRTTFDYLLEAMPKKLKSFCDACGLQDEYAAGSLEAEHCRGQEMRAKVDIEPAKGDYPAKNVIREYLPRGASQPAAQRAQAPASAPAGGNGNGSDARTAARKQFLVKWSAHLNAHPEDRDNRNEAWFKALLDFYPGKTQEQITSAEWMRIGQAFKVWDPIRGFPGKSQEPPFAEAGTHFKDDDIPF